MTVPDERDRVAPSWRELLDAASAVWSATGRTGTGLPRELYVRLYQAAAAHLCHRYAGCFDEDAQAVVVISHPAGLFGAVLSAAPTSGGRRESRPHLRCAR